MSPPLQLMLLCRTPLTARRVLYVGKAGDEFAAAARARNPDVEIITDPTDPGAPFDCCVAEVAAPADIPVLTGRLADRGVVVAALPALDEAGVQALLAVLPSANMGWLTARPLDASIPFDDRGEDLADALRRKSRCPPMIIICGRAASAPDLMTLRIVAYSHYLMDIRTTLPAQAMRSAPGVAVVYSNAPATLPSVPADQPKILVLQRPLIPDPDTWRDNLVKILRAGWVSVLEFDDHPELVAAIRGTSPTWHTFTGAHAVQTSTPSLGKAFRAWNPEVGVFPNAAFEMAPFREGPAPRRVVFGAFRRGRYAMDVMRSFEDIPREFPDVEFVVIGDRAVFDAIPAPRKTLHEAMPYADYLKVMSTCSISLTPIETSPLIETKSDAKFIDASSQGLLTIASPAIYADSIRHGETGLIAEQVEDWAPLLAGVLRDDARRERIARAAWEHVRDTRMFRHQIGDRLAWYRSLWDRRETLTKALLERTPGLAEAVSEPG